MSSTTSFRSFTVFVDAPASEDTETKTKSRTLTHLSRSLSESSLSSVLSSVSPTDKENFDPLTGERVVSSTALGKKRKGSISVLAVKLAPEMKLSKEKDVSSSEPQPEAKKRKSTISSSSSSKHKSKKDSKMSISGKTSVKRSSRRPSPMPKLDEEAEEQTRVNQALVNSKCYDLTVKPLADVSEAYEKESDSTEGQDVFRFVKERSSDPEIRDYFPSGSYTSFSSSSTTFRGSSPAELKTFSTPERKQIYSAFTFTSPSPTSEHLTKSKRSASMPPLDFGAQVKTS